MQLNDLRKELKFNVELLSLVETLKNVAGSQYHIMEKQKERFDRFREAFSGFFRVVGLVDVEDPLVRVASDVIGIIIITSDSGFMGGLNQSVVRAGLREQGDRPDSEVELVVIGEKGEGLIGDQGRRFKYFPGVTQETIYEQATAVRDYIVQEVLAGRMGKVVVAYPRPISFTAQTVEVVSLLPCAELFDRGAEDMAGEAGKGPRFLSAARRVIVESTFSDIVEYLSSTWVTFRLYELLEDSKLAEFSARAMHLEGSFQKVEKENKKLKHRFTKASHEEIDKGMRESFSAKGGSVKRRRRRKAATARAQERDGVGPVVST